jgi:hypothetical protein
VYGIDGGEENPLIPPPREQMGQNPGLFCVYPHRSHFHTVVIPPMPVPEMPEIPPTPLIPLIPVP